jgi:hypothetical protein
MTEAIFLFAAVLTIIPSMGFAIVWIWRRWDWWPLQPRPHRVVSSEDPAWSGIERLHAYFEGEAGDSIEDMKSWIDEWNISRVYENRKMDEILIVVRQKFNVIGYIWGQYYLSDQYAFISYVRRDDVDRDRVRNSIFPLLLSTFYREIEKSGLEWKAIIAELEHSKIDKFGRDMSAHKLFYVFSDAAKKMKKNKRYNINVYRLCMHYCQPVLLPHDVPVDYQPRIIPSMYQWILYCPRNTNKIIEKQGKKYLSKIEASEVLSFIYERLYADAFPASKAAIYENYQKYLTIEEDFFESMLGDFVLLAPDRDSAAMFSQGSIEELSLSRG